jgi:hypothetical protein
MTRDNIDSTICVPGFTKSIRPPAHYTSRLKREQLDDPNCAYADRSMRDFEEDHDVPLEGRQPLASVGRLNERQRLLPFAAARTGYSSLISADLATPRRFVSSCTDWA